MNHSIVVNDEKTMPRDIHLRRANVLKSHPGTDKSASGESMLCGLTFRIITDMRSESIDLSEILKKNEQQIENYMFFFISII